MPRLDWNGKEKVINHHLQVPYRVMELQYTYGQADSGNVIVHGDNLDALKALLPRYEGRVKLVYIDPPYNTGNENWVYNDNVNDPKIRKWLGEVVGKEGEDLSRHDKWLCMMYPRLRLLQRLLADDGAIFISIDDNELASLRFVCDEIFGASNYVSTISWQRTYAPRSDSKGISAEVEYLLVYGKSADWSPGKLPRTEQMNAKYGRSDGDPQLWRADNPCAADSIQHQGMVYGIQHPFNGKILYPPAGSHWRTNQQELLAIMNEWAPYELRDIDDADKRADICSIPPSEVRQGVQAIMLAVPVEEARRLATKRLRQGTWPLFYFTRNGEGGIARKTYLNDKGGRVVTNLWPHTEAGHTDEAKKILKAIFGSNPGFDTPKPLRLLDRVLQIATDRESIILDSFAGSGTTAHAVLDLNKRDGGNRRFILVEMEDYAETLTAERVKRVIDGYGTAEGTGGGFSYYELGDRLLLEDGTLNENLDPERIREYVWYTETRADYVPQQEQYLLGVRANTAYYFYYERGHVTALNHDFLRKIKTEADSYVIYADVNALSVEEMDSINLRFKKIPRDITRL